MIAKSQFNGISIVIPYYNDAAHIGQCLDSIAASWNHLALEDRRKVEVIIIDDHSPVPFVPPKIDLEYLVYRQNERKGSGAARNKGTSLSRWSHILFVDSDVILDSTFLPALFQKLSNAPNIKVLQCAHSMKSADPSPTLFQNYLAISWHLYSSQEMLAHGGEPSTLYSGMAIIEKSFFLSLGGFSEAFRNSGGEEFDFSSRLSKCPPGTIVYDESLVSSHYYDRLNQRLRKLWRRSQSYPLTCGNNLKIPFSFKITLIKRILFAYAMTLSMVIALFKFWLGIKIYALLYILFGLADNLFTRYMIRNHSWRLGFLSVLYRQLEYTIIGAGVTLGAFRELFKMPLNKYKFLFTPYPPYLIFWVTQNCNFKCRHCFNYKENSKQNNDLSLDEIRKIALNMGHIKYLTLSGGEPFIREDLNRIAQIFYQFNNLHLLNIVTNGWFHDRIEVFAKSVLLSCPKLYLNIAVSMDGTKERHNLIRQQEGSFERALTSVKILKQLSESPQGKRLSVIAVSTYNRENADDLSSLSEFLSKNFRIPLYMNLIRTNDVRDNNLLDIDIDYFREIYDNILRNIEKNLSFHYPFRKVRLALEEVLQDIIYDSVKHNRMTAPCKAGKKGFVLTANGDILLCEILNIRLGNVREFGYAPYRILNSPQAKQEIKKIIDNRCHCTWECFQRLNIIYSPRLYFRLIRKILRNTSRGNRSSHP